MRRRLQCKTLLEFRSGQHPCHKILVEALAGDILENEDGSYELRNPEKLTVKCNGCGKITTIWIRGGQINGEDKAKE